MTTELSICTAQLEKVRAKISEIEDSCSEYSIATASGSQRRKKNHELTVLYARESNLIKRIAQLQQTGVVGGTTYLANFDGR